MLTWTLEEIQISRQVCFTHLEEEKVKELYHIWGGIPCYVLESAQNEQKQSELNKAILTCDPNIFRYVGEVYSIEDNLVYIYTNVPALLEEIEQEKYTEDDKSKEVKREM
ncbi:15510_t:CDS:1 [Funneliformis geosporum]|uniref:15510_t:CDS:1 n=1 Tax=Funneliformis geosporum TaxID=1117311 RepID=A0A9W4X257_9GLOM|nr:15510_t:CDS:1 [Funneliformis geosporum]